MWNSYVKQLLCKVNKGEKLIEFVINVGGGGQVQVSKDSLIRHWEIIKKMYCNIHSAAEKILKL